VSQLRIYRCNAGTGVTIVPMRGLDSTPADRRKAIIARDFAVTGNVEDCSLRDGNPLELDPASFFDADGFHTSILFAVTIRRFLILLACIIAAAFNLAGCKI
jgi:hypothetical protein